MSLISVKFKFVIRFQS